MSPRAKSGQTDLATADPEHAGRFAVIGRLSELELDLLAVLALLDEPASIQRWADEGQARGIRSAARALGTKELEATAERLTELQLVSRLGHTPSRPLYAVSGANAMAALEIARERDRLDRLSTAELSDRSRVSLYYVSHRPPLSDMRLAALRGDAQAVRRALAHPGLGGRDEVAFWLIASLGISPQPAWLTVLPEASAAVYLETVLCNRRLTLRAIGPQLVDQALAIDDKDVRREVGRALVLVGQAERAAGLAGMPRRGAEGLALLAAFCDADYARAHRIGEELVRTKGKKPVSLSDVEGACHLLSTIAICSSQPEAVDALGRLIRAGYSPRRGTVHPDHPLADVYVTLLGDSPPFEPFTSERDLAGSWMDALIHLLHDVWLRPRKSRGERTGLREAQAVAEAWRRRAVAGGYPSLARELAEVTAALAGRSAGGLAGAFHPPAPWEAALASLEAVVEPAAAADAAPSARELVWEVEFLGEELAIRPRVRAGTRARKGQTISVARLQSGDESDLLTDADRRILATATIDPWSRTPSPVGTVLGLTAAVALIGHPRVIDPDGAPVAVERGRPTIRVHREQGATSVELEPAGLRRAPVAVDEPEPGRIVVYERGAALDRLTEIMNRGAGLVVPEEGRERLGRALARLAAAASVAIAGDLDVRAREMTADPRPVFQLAWNGAALAVSARVAPLGLTGPALRPGAGAASLIGELREPGGSGELGRCERDLADERRRLDAALDRCPGLAGFAAGDLAWTAPDLPGALDVMVELGQLGDDVVLAWQGGQKLEVPRQVDLGQLRVAVGAGGGWLDVDLSLQVDEGTVVGFRELLRSREGPRFVALSRGRFLALSDRLRRRIDGFASLGALHGDGVRASPAVLPLAEELAAETADPRFDAAALARLEKLRAIATEVPRVPRGFGASLRDYQREGFEWVARLAEAGLGGCLADDMGLGKTLQALALLVHRARLGPAVVVCPTSVVLHWIAEAGRFAPTLRMHSLAAADDRGALIAAAGPRDVLVASYTLLAGEIDVLAEAPFATAVFDEAHALKNARTQRAAAARRLRADFRLALTGTPIENHLGELWSLFAAVLPGLLGSESDYVERFGSAAAGDRERVARLRALLRPFILRRLKSQVLDELPPRTEITLRIDPYPEERAFYEAIRRRAVERTAQLDPKKARFQVLAEITRLRQAAIDPRVVDGAAGPRGAKLDALIERLLELRAEGHRALVFTQFLGSLAAVRERLVAEGIEHHEIEGSTPAAERARRIDAFQAGEGDVFLLSLRAGGTGINLTAADYVFHLDPWWNPAVEDQASDRAHRIGQERPVTVYRLVTAGTIEEKILALHGSKRQLADDLLAGLDRSEALDLGELLRLLQD